MVHSTHWRSSEGLLWLMYWGYAYNVYDVLSESCISQTARWSIQCTRDHWRGCFDWCTEVTHIYDVLLESCRSQTARWFIQCTGDHQRGCFDWHTDVTHILYTAVKGFQAPPKSTTNSNTNVLGMTHPNTTILGMSHVTYMWYSCWLTPQVHD